MTATPVCLKCQGEMEEGFLQDSTYGGQVPTQWVEGEPEKSLWFGTKTSKKEQLRVATYRCKNCGYLESYARQTK